MAEDVETPDVTDDDFDLEAAINAFDDVAEEEDDKLDKEIEKLRKVTRTVAEKQIKADRQAEVDRLTGEFYAKASDDEKQFADVLLAGVSDPQKVKKMLDLAAAKAKALNPDDGAGDDNKDAPDGDDGNDAFTPPVGNEPPRVRDKEKELIERIGRGGKDGMDALLEALYPKGSVPGMKYR